MLAGIAAGLAVATKETAVIVLPGVAGRLRPRVVVARRCARPPSRRPTQRWRQSRARQLRRSARRIASLFYSSFLTHPRGVLEPLRAAATYVERGVDPAEPRAPVALLPRPPRVVVVRRPGVDRGARARPGRRRRGDGVDPARSVDGPHAAFWRRYLTGNAAAHPGDLLRHPLQDALEPAPLLRRDDRRGRHRRRGAGAGDGVPWRPCLAGWRARDRRPATWAGRRGGRRSCTRRTRAIRTSMRRRSRTRSAWRRASAIWPPCTPTATRMLVWWSRRRTSSGRCPGICGRCRMSATGRTRRRCPT